MTSHTTEAGLVVFCPLEELSSHDLSPETLTERELLTFLYTQLSSMEQALPSYPEIEVFSTDTGMLIFLRPRLTYRSSFSAFPRIFS